MRELCGIKFFCFVKPFLCRKLRINRFRETGTGPNCLIRIKTPPFHEFEIQI